MGISLNPAIQAPLPTPAPSTTESLGPARMPPQFHPMQQPQTFQLDPQRVTYIYINPTQQPFFESYPIFPNYYQTQPFMIRSAYPIVLSSTHAYEIIYPPLPEHPPSISLQEAPPFSLSSVLTTEQPNVSYPHLLTTVMNNLYKSQCDRLIPPIHTPSTLYQKVHLFKSYMDNLLPKNHYSSFRKCPKAIIPKTKSYPIAIVEDLLDLNLETIECCILFTQDLEIIIKEISIDYGQYFITHQTTTNSTPIKESLEDFYIRLPQKDDESCYLLTIKQSCKKKEKR
ncbi:MAG TPA: hypothetical protein P5048_05200 [Chlamydiales bacterium]|nr:hypothetical protein [Chlamydiales bacterium]